MTTETNNNNLLDEILVDGYIDLKKYQEIQSKHTKNSLTGKISSFLLVVGAILLSLSVMNGAMSENPELFHGYSSDECLARMCQFFVYAIVSFSIGGVLSWICLKSMPRVYVADEARQSREAIRDKMLWGDCPSLL